MTKFFDEHLEPQIRKYAARDPELYAELHDKLLLSELPVGEPAMRAIINTPGELPGAAAGMGPVSATLAAETVVSPHARPVMVIRNNRVTDEFVGPDSSIWAGRVIGAQGILDTVIPSIGRVEVNNNPDYLWVGTGWLVAEDILVTNRHVAREFARQGREGFVFRAGLNGGPQVPRIDFLEEYGSAQSLEFTVDSVLWIATPSEPDVAFLRIRKSAFGPSLPPPIPLAEYAEEDEFVATVGYPAKDDRVPDQALVRRYFGDVYEKKRLSPGQVISAQADDLKHDCSTLGGNSGSPVVSLTTGKAIGLHYAGTFLVANHAVPAPLISELLEKALRSARPGARAVAGGPPRTAAVSPAGSETTLLTGAGPESSCTLRLNIPIEITVRVGGMTTPVVAGVGNVAAAPLPAFSEDMYEAALRMARQAVAHRADVVDVRLGYRFKRGWITDERVVVVEVRNKLGTSELRAANVEPIPGAFGGVGVDVRTAPLQDQLESLGISLEGLERLPRPGAYREPPDLKLERGTRRMRAIFHASPDCGFPCLKDFLGRAHSHLTATMYEWEPNHITNEIEAAVLQRGCDLTMVTQKKGTEKAIVDLSGRVGGKLRHAWASVGGGRLFPTAYHIKVASRDGEEFWLSSGNWKDSNQPDINPAGSQSTHITPLRKHNREWHAVVADPELATLFQKFIEWDFQEAERVPVEEAPEIDLPDLFVPETVFDELEARGRGKYFPPLEVDRELDIQPLLTPDQDGRGKRVFITAAIGMLKRAEHSICVQNQSFNLLGENVDEFEEFFSVLRDRQDAGVDVRIIFRDPREFGQANAARLDALLETLKEFGLDTDKIKVQQRCHTKGIIIDGKEVLLGSHNLTNSGALYNRDASLLIRDAQVAEYFLKLFTYDWDTLANQEAEELVGGVELAPRGMSTPAGFRRVSAAEVLGLV